MEIIEVTPSLRQEYNLKLQTFEKIFSYPLGNDRFTIDHGEDYYAFFDRLGKPYIFVGVNNFQEIVAVAIAVLRDTDLLGTGQLEKVWYICDLKVHPNYRGKHFVRDVLERAFATYGPLSTQIYGITMNPAFEDNKIIQFASRIPHLNLKFSGELLFYILDETQKDQLKPLMLDMFGHFNFISLRGQKDLILASTGLPLPFVHYANNVSVQPNEIPSQQNKPYQYMFCFPSIHRIIHKISSLDISPASSASILSNINNADWSFIKSCDI